MDKNCPGREGQRKKPIKVGGCEKGQCVQWTEFGLAEVRRKLKRKGEAEGAGFHQVSSARLRGLQRLRLFLVKLGS